MINPPLGLLLLFQPACSTPCPYGNHLIMDLLLGHLTPVKKFTILDKKALPYYPSLVCMLFSLLVLF